MEDTAAAVDTMQRYKVAISAYHTSILPIRFHHATFSCLFNDCLIVKSVSITYDWVNISDLLFEGLHLKI